MRKGALFAGSDYTPLVRFYLCTFARTVCRLHDKPSNAHALVYKLNYAERASDAARARAKAATGARAR